MRRGPVEDVPEAPYLALAHILTAAKGAVWLGIRELRNALRPVTYFASIRTTDWLARPILTNHFNSALYGVNLDGLLLLMRL
jgi:hypothetical protein